MIDSPWREELGPAVRTLQIIVGALTAGSVVFLIVAIVLSGAIAVEAGNTPILTYVALGFAAMVLLARPIVSNIIVATGRSRIAKGTWQPPGGQQANRAMSELLERMGDAGKLVVINQVRTIVAGALLEGAAFLLLVVYLAEHSWISLAVAIVFILTLAMHFPTRQRLIAWIENQLAVLEQQRQFGQ